MKKNLEIVDLYKELECTAIYGGVVLSLPKLGKEMVFVRATEVPINRPNLPPIAQPCVVIGIDQQTIIIGPYDTTEEAEETRDRIVRDVTPWIKQGFNPMIMYQNDMS